MNGATLASPGLKSVPARPVPERPFQYRDGRLCCDNVDLVRAADEFGTPLYLYSAAHMRYRASLFAEAFAGQSNTLCFAVKANSTLAVLHLFAAQGTGFDIVSGGELERVRRAAPDALRQVVFSGVGKQAWEIDAALQADILLFNVESEAELLLLSRRARVLGRRARVALRVNPDVSAETHPYISTGLREHKFGIEIARARELYNRARALPELDLAGVSVHIGSQICSVTPFGEALGRVAGLVRELRSDGLDIRYVDAGGGLGISYESGADQSSAGKVAAYGREVQHALAGLDVHLILEPGRFLVAQAGGLLTRVLQTKRNGTKVFVIADAGMNDLLRPSLYGAHHEMLAVLDPGDAQPSETVDVVGPVCETGDFFARDRQLPPMREGDLMLIEDTGAYGMSLASNYNTRGRAAEVLVDNGSVHLIRRRETIDDLLRGEMLTPL